MPASLVFLHTNFRDTYIERKPHETANDRNDRAIRTAALWYKDHLIGSEIQIVLLTNDKENLSKAKADGLQAYTGIVFNRFILLQCMLLAVIDFHCCILRKFSQMYYGMCAHED